MSVLISVLTDVKENIPVKIIGMNLKYPILLKLAEMGIFQSSIIQIVKKVKKGPIIVKCRRSSVILGHNIAKMISIEFTGVQNNEV